MRCVRNYVRIVCQGRDHSKKLSFPREIHGKPPCGESTRKMLYLLLSRIEQTQEMLMSDGVSFYWNRCLERESSVVSCEPVCFWVFLDDIYPLSSKDNDWFSSESSGGLPPWEVPEVRSYQCSMFDILQQKLKECLVQKQFEVPVLEKTRICLFVCFFCACFFWLKWKIIWVWPKVKTIQ